MKITLLQNKLITFTLQLYAFTNFRIKKDQKFQSRHPSERTVSGRLCFSQLECSPKVLALLTSFCQLATLLPAFNIISPLFAHRQYT